ncbi:unnamed protein product [Paramecium octaurelia]|uniref:Uncharacterized protein n=1 Tax=Paramecium octaurelia TaxID=43137 RepID=A0A8S1WL87_PAROT|nr:unnamed protein product [Paramecium octaurelia]
MWLVQGVVHVIKFAGVETDDYVKCQFCQNTLYLSGVQLNIQLQNRSAVSADHQDFEISSKANRMQMIEILINNNNITRNHKFKNNRNENFPYNAEKYNPRLYVLKRFQSLINKQIII